MLAEGAASGGLGEISTNPRMPRVTAKTSDQEQSNPAYFCILRIPLTGREEGTRDWVCLLQRWVSQQQWPWRTQSVRCRAPHGIVKAFSVVVTVGNGTISI